MKRRPRTGFTLIELLVVVAIIVALLAILMPSLNKALGVAINAQCMSQQRQVLYAAIARGADNFGLLPESQVNGLKWLSVASRDEFDGYVGGQGEVFYCPALTGADWDLSTGVLGAANVGKDADFYWNNGVSYGGGSLRHIGCYYAGNPISGGSYSTATSVWRDTVGATGSQDDYVIRIGGTHASDAAVVVDGLTGAEGGPIVAQWPLRHPNGYTFGEEGSQNAGYIDASVRSVKRADMKVRWHPNFGW